jgi:YD repeat-containing protein
MELHASTPPSGNRGRYLRSDSSGPGCGQVTWPGSEEKIQDREPKRPVFPNLLVTAEWGRVGARHRCRDGLLFASRPRSKGTSKSSLVSIWLFDLFVGGESTMKTYVALVIGMTVLAVAPALRAQQCYTPVTSWKEPVDSYSLSANSNGSISCTVGTCTMNQSVAGNPKFFLAGMNCSDPHVFWQSDEDTITSAAVQDTSSTPCPPFPPLNVTLTGTGGAASTATQLLIYPSSKTYTFEPIPQENYSETVSGCTGGGQGTGTINLYPSGTWPHTFSITPNVQPITSSTTFNQPTYFDGGTNVPWTFNFTLDPKYFPDDDCKPDGGAGFPAASSIGCQNQSLGEDVPIVGTGFDLHYESDRAPGAGADSAAASDAFMIGGWTLNVHHGYDVATNTLFLGNGTQRNGYQLGALVMFNNNALFTSANGDEVYVFARTPQGTAQHVQTLRPLTGALVYQFGYDSAGQLVTVTDGSGNVTTIKRNAFEQATAIVAPFGQTTTLNLDSNGFLSQATDPLGKSATFVNSGTGLLMPGLTRTGTCPSTPTMATAGWPRMLIPWAAPLP